MKKLIAFFAAVLVATFFAVLVLRGPHPDNCIGVFLSLYCLVYYGITMGRDFLHDIYNV